MKKETPDFNRIKDTLLRLDDQITPSGELSPGTLRFKLNGKKQNKLSGKGKFSIGMVACATAAILVGLVVVPSIQALLPKKTDFVVEAKNYDAVYNAIDKLKKQQEGSLLDNLFGRTKSGNFTNDLAPAQQEGAVSNDKTGAPESSDSNSYGKTNLQVEGVDEADIIKNDGKNLYVISRETVKINEQVTFQYKLTVLDCSDPKNPKKAGSVTYPAGKTGFIPNEMFFSGSSLIVIGNFYDNTAVPYYGTDEKAVPPSDPDVDEPERADDSAVTTKDDPDRSEGYTGTGSATASPGSADPVPADKPAEEPATGAAVEPAIAPDYYYGYNTSKVGCIIYDISDINQLTELRRFEQDGWNASTRLINGRLYFISTYYVNLYAKDTEDRLEAYIPKVSDTKTGAEDLPIPAGNISIMPEVSSSTYLVLSVLDINDSSRDIYTKAILGVDATNIYCAKENLYITKSVYNDYYKTGIVKFSIKDFIPEFVAEGKVDGQVLNQFSMDEYNGNFRIATTSYTTETFTSKDGNTTSVSVGGTTNNVYILNGNMELIGKLEGLAPTERIYSARFKENMAYLVTYRQTDPLFAIDLTDPTAPKLMGELKIPGFSEQMHFYDDTTLLGVGQGEDETRGRTNVKLSLFDVSDPKQPVELATAFGADLIEAAGLTDISGINYTYSTAQYSFKALLLNTEKNIIGLDVTIYDSNGTYNYYLIVGADKTNGFTLRKLLKTEQTTDTYGYYYGVMLNRGTYINDTLYHITDGVLSYYDINNLSQIGKLEF